MDSEVRVRGFTSRSAPSNVTVAAGPVTGTVPSTGSRGMAYGLMLRCVTIAENQLNRCTTSSGRHAATVATSTAATSARLPMPHLLGTGALEQRFHAGCRSRGRRDEDPELVVGEAGVVGDAALVPGGEEHIEGNAEQRGERSKQDRHLEHDDDVRRDRSDRLAPDLDGPVVRHIQRDPRPDRASRDAGDQRVHSHRTHRLGERVLELVARDRKSTRLNSSHGYISYAVFCLKKKTTSNNV